MYGDIALNTVPVNPQDVLDIFPEACSLIGTGVPVSVTLQPIPEDVVGGAIFVNQIEKNLLMELLDTFSDLDDVRSRFEVLISASKVYKDFIPILSNVVKRVSSTFRINHRSLITKLAACISEMRSSTHPSANTSDLITEAEELYEEHTSEEQSYHAPRYPSNLAGLEGALSDFELFIAIAENNGLHLTAFRDVILDVLKYSNQVLVPMPPLFKNAHSNLLRFSSLSMAATAAYSNQNPQLPVYCLYVEDKAILEKRLPNDNKFSQLTQPNIFVGTKANDGEVTWKLESISKVLALMPKTLYYFGLDLVVDVYHQ